MLQKRPVPLEKTSHHLGPAPGYLYCSCATKAATEEDQMSAVVEDWTQRHMAARGIFFAKRWPDLRQPRGRTTCGKSAPAKRLDRMHRLPYRRISGRRHQPRLSGQWKSLLQSMIRFARAPAATTPNVD